MYAIVDIETTGSFAASHGITELAIFVHDGKKLVQKFSSLINPKQKIPLHITALTGISNEMVQNEPCFEDIAEEVYTILKDKIFVAHSVNFDYSFVQQQLKASGYDFNEKKLCTVRLSRRVFPGLASYSLGNLCRTLDIPIEHRHRAGGDAAATVRLFEKILAGNGYVHIQAMLKRGAADHWLPTLLDKTVIEKLPACPGVYYFHDQKQKIIYVGKAINIKKRVTGHFTHTDNGKRRQGFLRLVADISYKTCVSELHALVLESTEIKRLWPKYNWAQKQPVQKYALYHFEDNRGYSRLAIDKKKKNLPSLYNFNLLHEGTVLLRKMSEEFGLHEKLCYLNKAAIDNKDLEFLEEPMLYNGRVKQAMETLTEKLPSFAIIDAAPGSDEMLCMLIERGSFWGMGYISNGFKPDLHSLKEVLQPHHDNDFIRNSIFKFAAQYPEKTFRF